MDDLKLHFERFRKSDEERETLVSSLVEEVEKLRAAYEDKCNDYENEVESRRNLQTKVKTMGRELDSAVRSIDSDPYALALIDGDGCICTHLGPKYMKVQRRLIAAGSDGGADAAQRLQTELRNHLASVCEGADKWPLRIQIYASVDGLARKLAHCGIVKSPNDFWNFCRAFTLTQPLFDIVDVGFGKERADHKIRGKQMAVLHLKTTYPARVTTVAATKHVNATLAPHPPYFFTHRVAQRADKDQRCFASSSPITSAGISYLGGCHDNGYLNTLMQYKFDEAMSSRITLLESIPRQPGFADLNFPTIRLESIFRTDNLPERPNGTIPPRRTPPPRDQNALIVSTTPAATAPIKNQSPVLSATAPAWNGSSAMATTTGDSWAAIGSAGMTSKSISIAPATKKPQKKFYLLNVAGARVDPPLQPYDPATWRALNERIHQKRLCNLYHLRGPERRPNGEHCGFQHGDKLNATARNVLAVVVRGQACSARRYCDNVDCFYGHHCRWGAECNRDNCRWEDSDWHYIDRTPAWKIYEDGTQEKYQA